MGRSFSYGISVIDFRSQDGMFFLETSTNLCLLVHPSSPICTITKMKTEMRMDNLRYLKKYNEKITNSHT